MYMECRSPDRHVAAACPFLHASRRSRRRLGECDALCSETWEFDAATWQRGAAIDILLARGIGDCPERPHRRFRPRADAYIDAQVDARRSQHTGSSHDTHLAHHDIEPTSRIA